MRERVFKTAFLSKVPDADAEKHRGTIRTSKCELQTVFVKDTEEAVRTCRKLVEESGIQSILLCPGFTHSDIAKIVDAVGEGVSVNVARGDGPSNRAALDALKDAGFPLK